MICFSTIVACFISYTANHINPESKSDLQINLKAEKPNISSSNIQLKFASTEKNSDSHNLLFVRIKINQVVTRFIQLQKTDQRRKELTSQSLTNPLEFLNPPGYYNNFIRPPII